MDPSLIIPSRVQDWEGVTAPAGANGRCNNLAEGNSNSRARQLNYILLPRRTTLYFLIFVTHLLRPYVAFISLL